MAQATDIEELKRLAGAATPGPWRYESEEDGHNVMHCGYYVAECFDSAGAIDIPQDTARKNGPFIAAANPAAIKSLIAQLEAAQAELAAIRALEPVARVVSMYGDPEAFGERDVAPLASLRKLPYGTSLVALPEQK